MTFCARDNTWLSSKDCEPSSSPYAFNLEVKATVSLRYWALQPVVEVLMFDSFVCRVDVGQGLKRIEWVKLCKCWKKGMILLYIYVHSDNWEGVSKVSNDNELQKKLLNL